MYETTTTNLYHHNWFGSTSMAILDNLEASMPDEVNPKVVKIIEEMKSDSDFQVLMQRLASMEEDDAWNNEGGMVTETHIKDYEERLKYMEDHGI